MRADYHWHCFGCKWRATQALRGEAWDQGLSDWEALRLDASMLMGWLLLARRLS